MTLDTVATRASLRAVVAAWRRAGLRVGVVPTMGSLHEGHLGLVDRAKRLSDRVVATVFVNPLQFGPAEDLARYPRDLDRDRDLLAVRGADLLYAPAVAEMYPVPPMIRVDPGPLAGRLEGSVRPGHFAGVLTVVAKLFHQTAADVACFGQKDIQQATMIRRMVTDLDWPIEIAVVPTVRDHDGLALSSRNGFLSPVERREALVLSRTLRSVNQAWRSGVVSGPRLVDHGREALASEPAVQADYLVIVDPDRLEPVETAGPGSIVAVAARVGTTRLIDNIILGEVAA